MCSSLALRCIAHHHAVLSPPAASGAPHCALRKHAQQRPASATKSSGVSPRTVTCALAALSKAIRGGRCVSACDVSRAGAGRGAHLHVLAVFDADHCVVALLLRTAPAVFGPPVPDVHPEHAVRHLRGPAQVAPPALDSSAAVLLAHSASGRCTSDAERIAGRHARRASNGGNDCQQSKKHRCIVR